jgi:hypothetical protein
MSRESRDDERRDARYGMRDTGCEIRDTGYGMRDPRFTARISNRVSRILKGFMNIAGWNNSLKVVMLTLLLEEELYQ